MKLASGMAAFTFVLRHIFVDTLFQKKEEIYDILKIFLIVEVSTLLLEHVFKNWHLCELISTQAHTFAVYIYPSMLGSSVGDLSSYTDSQEPKLTGDVPDSSVSASSTDVIATPSSRHFFMWAFDFICFVRFPITRQKSSSS